VIVTEGSQISPQGKGTPPHPASTRPSRSKAGAVSPTPTTSACACPR
jgi:hypothetical protein